MADPRTYEQLLEVQLRSVEGTGSRSRLAALEAEVAELVARLAERERELAKARAELARPSEDESGRARNRALEVRRARTENRARIAESEREAALREMERLRIERDRLKSRVDALQEKVDQAEARMAGLEQELGLRPDEVAGLRRASDAAELQGRRIAAEYGARVRELEQLVSILAGSLAQTKEDVDRAASSRAWRWGHGVTKALRRLALRRNVTEGALARALTRIEQVEQTSRGLPEGTLAIPAGGLAPAPTVEAVDDRTDEERLQARAELAREIRTRLGEVPQRDQWPGVSLIVPTRNGRDHLERLIAGLRERTDYPNLELVVVDNASTDGTKDLLGEIEPDFPVQAIVNAKQASFSESNNQGVEQANHELLLFLNNDVEPFESGWLRELVAAHERSGAGAAGATLLRSVAGNDPRGRDRTVQHRSIKFRIRAGEVWPYNEGDGEDLFADGFGIEDRAPAVTAACLMIERSVYESSGGFATGYRFGTEDVDLGLRLNAAGRDVVASGRSILYHRESATQSAEGRDFMRANRTANRRLFLERWGAHARRGYRLGRLRRDPHWTDGRGPHIAITVTSLDPEDGWGDWYTAHELGAELIGLGWHVTYIARKGDAWYTLPEDVDFVLSLMDPFDLRRVPDGVTTVVWVRNWTERWLEQPWFARADILLASSGRSADLIERATGRSSIHFPLATNPARFAPRPPDPDLAADYVFTGNYWGHERDVQAGIRPRKDERFDVYGRDWDQVPDIAEHWRGSVPYLELPAIYASAKVVLDDTSGPTLPYGAVNTRVFDALAAGTFALTNCEAGVRELFDDEYPIWRSGEDLREQLDSLLADDARRERLARRYRGEVLRHHTYAHRARRLIEVLEEHERKPSFCIKIGAPSWEEAERWGDLHFARAIERELRARGHRCLIQVLDEWEDKRGLTYDVALVIRGLSRHHPKPGQLNVLWNISHPAAVTGEECNGYDLVCVASDRFAGELRERTVTPVVVLEQATDPRIFYPDPSPEFEHELVYVANSRGVLRPVVRDLLPTEHDLAIYGSNWAGLIHTKHVVAEHVPNEELRKVYSSARLVLCDHWDDMREHGFISNRIFDALACGATVISDEVAGLKERFGEAVLTYRTADELNYLIARQLREPILPRRTSRLPEGNWFDDRIERLLERTGKGPVDNSALSGKLRALSGGLRGPANDTGESVPGREVGSSGAGTRPRLR